MVELQAIRKSFGRNQVLMGVGLTVRVGEVCCVIGPSGSGKSTLLRCINHLEKVDSGRVRVDGSLIGYTERSGRLYELKEAEIAAQRREIGMVFQRFNLFPHLTALENVMEAPCRVRREDRAPGAGSRARAAGARRSGREGRRPARRSCPAVSSSGWPSPGRWQCSRR